MDRWNWLVEKNILEAKRYEQEKLWIYNKLKQKIGFNGFELIEKRINYMSKPFQYCGNILSRIKIILDSS